jgi:hypothetical protein
MSSARRILLAALVLSTWSAGCADRTSQTSLVEPQVGRYALSGRVRLVGRLTGSLGDSIGTRVMEDATGVRVRLSKPDGSTDSVLTQSGVFEFRVDDPGLYQAAVWVCPEIVAASQVMVADADTIFPDTLTLGPVSEISTYPNPFPSTHGLAIEFTPQSQQHVEVNVLTLAGVLVWSYGADLPAGFQHIHWAGIDDHGDPVPVGPYWCRVKRDGAHHYNLVFKE